jgi:hypothetical protein
MEPIEIARRFRGDKTSIHDAVTVASAQAIRQLLESLENETSLEKRYAVLNSEHFWDDYFDNNLLGEACIALQINPIHLPGNGSSYHGELGSTK